MDIPQKGIRQFLPEETEKAKKADCRNVGNLV